MEGMEARLVDLLKSEMRMIREEMNSHMVAVDLRLDQQGVRMDDMQTRVTMALESIGKLQQEQVAVAKSLKTTAPPQLVIPTRDEAGLVGVKPGENAIQRATLPEIPPAPNPTQVQFPPLTPVITELQEMNRGHQEQNRRNWMPKMDWEISDAGQVFEEMPPWGRGAFSPWRCNTMEVIQFQQEDHDDSINLIHSRVVVAFKKPWDPGVQQLPFQRIRAQQEDLVEAELAEPIIQFTNEDEGGENVDDQKEDSEWGEQKPDMEEKSGLAQGEGEGYSSHYALQISLEKVLEPRSEELYDGKGLESDKLDQETEPWEYDNTAEAAKAISAMVKFLWSAMEPHLLRMLACLSVSGFVAAMFKYFRRSRKVPVSVSQHMPPAPPAQVLVLAPHQVAQLPVFPSPESVQLPVFPSQQFVHLAVPKQEPSVSLELHAHLTA